MISCNIVLVQRERAQTFKWNKTMQTFSFSNIPVDSKSFGRFVNSLSKAGFQQIGMYMLCAVMNIPASGCISHTQIVLVLFGIEHNFQRGFVCHQTHSLLLDFYSVQRIMCWIIYSMQIPYNVRCAPPISGK